MELSLYFLQTYSLDVIQDYSHDALHRYIDIGIINKRCPNCMIGIVAVSNLVGE